MDETDGAKKKSDWRRGSDEEERRSKEGGRGGDDVKTEIQSGQIAPPQLGSRVCAHPKTLRGAVCLSHTHPVAGCLLLPKGEHHRE